MRGGKNKQPLGYTIVEVMIVLAVSGLMFVIAANFINGKQAKTAFTQGSNETASRIQGIVEQVTDGQFSDIPLQCDFNGTNTTVNGGAKSQGTNSTCTFLGKVFFFPSNKINTYKVLSLAGGRVDVSSGASPTINNVDPTIIGDLTNKQNIPQNLDVKEIIITDASGSTHNNYRNFGFLQGLGTATNGTFKSGAQTVALVYSPVAASPSEGGINGNLAYARAVSMCLTDGSRFAQVLIGSANNDAQLSVRLKAVHTC